VHISKSDVFQPASAKSPFRHFDPNVRPPFEHRGLYVKRGQMRGLVESTTLTSRTCVELVCSYPRTTTLHRHRHRPD